MSTSLKQELSAIKNKAVQRALKNLFDNSVVLQGSATWNPGNLVDAAGESKDVTVTGAALGDFAVASLGVDTVDIVVSASVTAANTVTVRLQNESGSAADLAETTVTVRVFPKSSYITA